MELPAIPAMASSRAARVLLIDDHGPSRRGYAEYLKLQGFSVMEAADGATGLAAALTGQPDIIILDLGLPDIDGWSIARELKAAASTCGVPIIALTGADLPHERASALRAGCDLHLGKPCMPRVLLDALHLFGAMESHTRVRSRR
jgi:DNA-binding response OmpR family regulator